MANQSITVDEVEVDLDDFQTEDIVDYLKSNGYFVKEVEQPNSIFQVDNLKDVELHEVLEEAYKKHGYKLTRLLQASIDRPELLKAIL